jgi:hypothetical protein
MEDGTIACHALLALFNFVTLGTKFLVADALSKERDEVHGDNVTTSRYLICSLEV